jgi:hypothetical protein
MSEANLVTINLKVNPIELQSLLQIYNLDDESLAIRKAIEQFIGAQEIFAAARRMWKRGAWGKPHESKPKKSVN